MYASFRCVVVTTSTSPSHSPVENPLQVWTAFSGGCGRPSIQIVARCPIISMWLSYAISVCVAGSTTGQNRSQERGPSSE